MFCFNVELIDNTHSNTNDNTDNHNNDNYDDNNNNSTNKYKQ